MRFAAAIPAILAISNGLPFGFFSRRTAATTSGRMFTVAVATAVRVVMLFCDTSTMRTCPDLP